MTELDRIKQAMADGEHTDGDLAYAIEQWEIACTEGGDRDGLIRLLLKECEEMEFDHSNACMNWSLCEHSQIECALCQLRDLVSGRQK